MRIHSPALPKSIRIVAISATFIAGVFALGIWLERSWQQWQIVRELEAQGIQVYLRGMPVPEEKRYSNLADFPAPLPPDQGTWRDFSRHLFLAVTALDFTRYAGLNADMTPFDSRLAQLLDELPQVNMAVGWQGTCGCCWTVDWCPAASSYGPIEHRHYTFDVSYRRQQTEARRKTLLAEKMRVTPN